MIRSAPLETIKRRSHFTLGRAVCGRSRLDLALFSRVLNMAKWPSSQLAGSMPISLACYVIADAQRDPDAHPQNPKKMNNKLMNSKFLCGFLALSSLHHERVVVDCILLALRQGLEETVLQCREGDSYFYRAGRNGRAR